MDNITSQKENGEQSMKIIGLTGGIGSGKSTAAAHLKNMGLKHIDADEIGRGLTDEGSPLLSVLDRIFGPSGEMGIRGTDILDACGRLDRKALASVVFTDADRKKRLDSIMFRDIKSEIMSELDSFREGGADAVIIDAPLLFESGLDHICDIVVLITADMETRIKRVCMRDGATIQEVTDRINSQMSDKEKASLSDIVLDNSGTQEQLYAELDDMLNKIL